MTHDFDDVSIRSIAQTLKLRPQQIQATAALLADGSTIPFIARYRKEATGELNEVQLAAISAALDQMAELNKRRESILKSLQERGLLTPELERNINNASTMLVLEDIYLPHRVKRRTRAQQARERGLGPIADAIMTGQNWPALDRFISDEVPDTVAALAGARDIIAEHLAEDPQTRAELRLYFAREAELRSSFARGKKDSEEAQRFRDYGDYAEPLVRAAGHRILAMLRGSELGFLKITARPDSQQAITILQRRWLKGGPALREQLDLAIQDSYERLLVPSLETEAINAAKTRADDEAINVFADNLRELLMSSPFGQRAVLAIDPGLRTGCKCSSLSASGQFLAHDVIYHHEPNRQTSAQITLVRLVKEYKAEAVAVGNGTAGRETQAFVEATLKKAGIHIPVVLVSESGASIYSASDVAREEFPNLDLTVRGAISIGRRLQDPLAELIKTDAKSIGVGQYQHDVDQAKLKQGLDHVVSSCVNSVGVELGTASQQLLAHIAGLGPAIAKNIIAYREEHGGFTSRKQLLKVPRLGAKVFEQCAGFLRIRDGKNPLDASAVHPERYALVEQMAKDINCQVSDLLTDDIKRRQIDIKRYVSAEVGEPTLRDILIELAKPGRDPRQQFTHFRFADVHSLVDLTVGMILPGLVSNVTKFGAFVDIGVKQDGLVHISQLADHFVSDPNDVVKVQQQVKVRVMEIDQQRKRVSLSMKGV